MRWLEIGGGREIPVIGQGTWTMGEKTSRRKAEVAALRLGLDLGMSLIDTAEMYGDGGAEEVVGEAIAGRREDAFVVSKVLPQNASLKGTLAAADRSLARLETDRIDLYLLHWEGPHPLRETFDAFEQLRAAGKIAAYGVSNFDMNLLRSAGNIAAGRECAANQVLYNLGRRGIEWRLLADCMKRGMVVMAYSPLEQGRLDFGEPLSSIARKHGVTPAQVALAWTVRNPGLVAIPKASRPEHVRQNAAAADLVLDAKDLELLDSRYPPPDGDAPLAML
jgi:diketogulonate reductase-like aldo/keto reductase